uniref:ZP domain-containing protein n=1 Tax=Gasterosteus aculeatus aculeatus TaxID=481459 RepID=G3P5P7_GASAC
LILLIVVENVETQKKPSINNSTNLLTQSLASQCGFSMKIDQLGNAMIFASLQNCFAENVKRPSDAGFTIKALVFFTPEERIMKVKEAQRRGYGISNTPTRLVLRAPLSSPETYIQTVAGLPMKVLKTSTIFENKWLATQIDAAAACPVMEGSVSFTPHSISWFLPRRIDPLISSGQFKLLEVHMGVDGQRLDVAKMAARRYSMSVNDLYIITEIPIGAVGGHFKSRVQDGQYFTAYTIEPMLELFWSEDSKKDTRYKVLLPITTPFLPQPPRVIDMPPSVSGGCDYQNFYILVKYGTPGFNFKTLVGKRMLTPNLAQQYNFMDNGTHFSVTVPFLALDVEIEAVEKSSIRSRLDVSLRSPDTLDNIDTFAVACDFFSTLTECFPNGTITTLAVKLESVPSLQLSQLTLRDPSCGPSYSDDRYAYFVFTGNSCGTTRTFLPTMMLYENEIFLPAPAMESNSKTEEFKVACYFDLHTNRAVAFNNRPRRSKPFAENGIEELHVKMRLALDDSYSTFYRADYIAKYLQQPLYFEVELTTSGNSVSLELVDCWATLEDDRTSLPKWDLIINGCANPRNPHKVIFHPVFPDTRVQHPSNFKRFEIPMFAFTKDENNLSRQVFVHCDVVVCDATNPVGRACNVTCSDQDAEMKGRRSLNLTSPLHTKVFHLLLRQGME